MAGNIIDHKATLCITIHFLSFYLSLIFSGDNCPVFSLSQLSVCVFARLLQSCTTLCNPVDHSPPGSSVQGILQARILEWVAMPSSAFCIPTFNFFPNVPSYLSPTYNQSLPQNSVISDNLPACLFPGDFTSRGLQTFSSVWTLFPAYCVCLSLELSLTLSQVGTAIIWLSGFSLY